MSSTFSMKQVHRGVFQLKLFLLSLLQGTTDTMLIFLNFLTMLHKNQKPTLTVYELVSLLWCVVHLNVDFKSLEFKD